MSNTNASEAEPCGMTEKSGLPKANCRFCDVVGVMQYGVSRMTSNADIKQRWHENADSAILAVASSDNSCCRAL